MITYNSKAAAMAAGVNRYFDGVPCINGHLSDRYTSNYTCTACVAESSKRRDKLRPDLVAKRVREYQERNRQEARARCRKWSRDNPGMRRAKGMRRHAAKIKRTPKWVDHGSIKAVYEAAAKLTAETGIKHHVDHIIPLQGKMVSGLHVAENLRVITAHENSLKYNSFPQLEDAYEQMNG